MYRQIIDRYIHIDIYNTETKYETAKYHVFSRLYIITFHK